MGFYGFSFFERQRMTTLFTDTKYVTEFVNVIKLLYTETKETNNSHKGDLLEHNEFSSIMLLTQVMTHLQAF
jgi:hypothetical protein